MEIFESDRPGPVDVVIAGGGVAALEALLALEELAGARVRTVVLSPETEFRYRPLAVAEPFGLVEPRRIELPAFAAEHGAGHRAGALAAVDPERRLARTAAGDELAYDALLVTVGAAAREALPGALTFAGGPDLEAFGDLLSMLETRAVRSVAFAAPAGATWTLPLYELALLTARRFDAGRRSAAEIAVVTPEPEPLGMFGPAAAERVRRLLGAAHVSLRAGAEPLRIVDGALVLADGERVAAERVVALPRLEVPPIEGLPQDRAGFIPTDPHGRVAGLERVFAAGDATTFPIKQGGLAAQQADAAAAAIARAAGAEVDAEPLRPVLRGVLLGGGMPQFMRAGVGDPATAASPSAKPLWWPPSKVAGRYLAPHLTPGPQVDERPQPLADRDEPEDEPAAEEGLDAALELALTQAEASAGWGDHRSALRWLEAAEQLGVVLPAEYAGRRREWRAAAARG